MSGTFPAAGPVLRARALRHRYRGAFWPSARQVLGELDLELEPGTFLGLIGPNGSGQSTLLRLAAGLERPWRGELRVFGGPADGARARAAVGYLGEAAGFPGELGPRVLRIS